jgi:PAS domain S-box-containing protein
MRPRAIASSTLPDALSIRSLLIAFAVALIVPTILFAGFLLWQVAEVEKARVAEEARRTGQHVAVAVERELTGMVATLEALATSPSLDADDLAAFQDQAARAVRAPEARIGLRDREGRQLMHTQVPYGETLPPAIDREPDLKVLSTGQPYVSDVMEGAVVRRPLIAVDVPVLRAGEVRYVLHMSVPLSHWLKVLQGSVADPVASVGLIDRKGVFIARLRQHEQFAGRPAGDDIRALRGDEGSVTRTNIQGQQVLFTYRRIATPGWLVGVGVPTDVVQAPLRRWLTLIIASGVTLLTLSVLLAAALGARIARPVRALSALAAKLGREEVLPPLATGLKEVNEVGRSLVAASLGLRERSAALRASEERYRLATEAFQGAVFDFDVGSNRSDRTQRAYEILGESPGALPSTMQGWHDRIHPDDFPAFQRARRRIYEEGAPQYEAEYRVRRRDGTWTWVWHRALALRDEHGKVCRVVGAILDITARRDAEEHLKLLVNELNHRVKNTLATVQSIAANSLRGATSVPDARAAFEARLLALSAAHNILTRENWEGARLRSIAVEVLEPYRMRHADRFVIEGPDLWISPANAVAIGMGLHELATNAAKYGALTTQAGLVRVTWTHAGEGAAARACLTWEEEGGPPVVVPLRKGFGSRLIERSLTADLGGEARLEFRPGGVVCTMSWALDPAAAPVAAYPARPLRAVT